MADIILGGNVLSDNTPDGEPILLGGNALTKAPSGGGAGGETVATVVLTDAQIKALPTTSITLVAAPGAGKLIVPSAPATVFWDTSGGGYVGGDNAQVFVALGGSQVSLSAALQDLCAGDAVHTAFLPGIARAVADGNDTYLGGQKARVYQALNQPLVLWAYNADASWNDLGDFTGGDASNRAIVSVPYRVLDTTA